MIDNQIQGCAEEWLLKFKGKQLIFTMACEGSVRSRIGQNSLMLLQKSLYYCISINEGILALAKENSILPIIILIRNNLEITGVLANFFRSQKLFYSDELTLEDLDELLYKYNLGSRAKELSEAPKSIQVLSGIDSLDYLLNQEILGEEKINLFREAYDYLSEFAHPNFHGLSIVTRFDDDLVRREDLQIIYNKSCNEFVEYLKISNETFDRYYDECLNLLKLHDDFPT